MDEFELFWAAYPKKRSKGDAFRAWGQTKKDRPALQAILDAIALQKRAQGWQKECGEYIPYPATWLRAWGWADVPAVDLSVPREPEPERVMEPKPCVDATPHLQKLRAIIGGKS